MKPIRLAVVGAGHLGRIHARLSKNIDAFHLVGVVDPLPAARQQVAAECHVPGYHDHGRLAGQIDAAVIATPSTTHHEVSLDLLRRGVHLLVEKPLATTAEEAEQLIQTARSRGVILQVGHVERFNPAFASALSLLGPPRYIEAARTQSYAFRCTDVGAVLDLMIHDVDLVLALSRSKVAAVQALGISIFGGLEDMAQARLQLENGCVVNLNASRASYQAQRRMHVYCDDAFAAIDFSQPALHVIRPHEDLLRRSLNLAQLGPQQQDQFRRQLFERWLPLQSIPLQQVNPLQEQLREFASSIRTGDAPRVSGLQAQAALGVAQQIILQIEQHRWDGTDKGPVGPLAIPAPSDWPTLPPLSTSPSPTVTDASPRRKAG